MTEPSRSIQITVNSSVLLGRVPAGFIGFGYETSAVAQPGFFSPENVKMIRLYRNLCTSGLIRIGGIISDHTRYEADGQAIVATQTGTTVITKKCLTDLGDFVRATGWSVMWGLNLETGTVQNAITEAKAVDRALGTSLHSFEIGNEVQAQKAFDEKFDNYYAAYLKFKRALRSALTGIPISGPDSIAGVDWVREYAKAEGADVKSLTIHYYRAGAPEPEATIENLLNTDTSLVHKLLELSDITGQTGIPYCFNEINSFWGGGKQGISDTFGSALWTLDTMYLLATHGCAGLNLQTDINQLGFISHYSPIVHDHTGCSPRPEYYGMLAFATSACGDLLKTNVTGSDVNLTAYASRHQDGSLWVTIINKDMGLNALVTIDVPSEYRYAGELLLTAPDISSIEHVTFGGSEVDDDGYWSAKASQDLPVTGGQTTVLVAKSTAVIVELTAEKPGFRSA